MKSIPVLFTAVMMLIPSTATLVAGEPTAASAAFTSRDPVVLKAWDLVKAGQFKEAETLLAAGADKADADARKAREEAVDIIHRIRVEYALDADGLLAKIKKSVPDATAEDVQRWADDSAARWRMIDGKKLYFRREPQNIFLFCEEAKARRAKAGNAPAESKWKLTDHLKKVVDEAEKTGKEEVLPIHHRITYTVTIRPNTPGVKAGSTVRAWLPYPQEYRQQRDVKMISTSPEARIIAPNAVDGTPVRGAAQRSVYFEQKVTDPSQPMEFKEVFEYNSFAYYPKLEEARVQPLPTGWNGDLGERPPHITFAPEIRQKVTEIVGADTNALVKARKIFRWVSANIPWNAEDEYCIIPSFVMKAFNARRGDCGLQNTVFITMCRIAGIPARWQSGWETKPPRWGNHDWAEFYVSPWGWLPADASYGVQKSDDSKVADFYCGHQDSFRFIVNLDWGRDFYPPKKSLRSEPADFQVGEVEVDGRNLYFNEWDYKMDVERKSE